MSENNTTEELDLHQAVQRGYTKTCQLLIEQGADVNSKDLWGRTPLFEASIRGYKEIEKLLTDAGAKE